MAARAVTARAAVAMLLAALVLATPASHAKSTARGIHWLPWSDDVFERARREHRLVLLDLEAVWCHWCHVMDVETYRDPAVMRVLADHYLAVKVDQDARPDLSNRYEDYGWPAIIVFGSDGTELVKRSGYIPAPGMAAMLEAVVKDPTPGPSALPVVAPTVTAGAMTDALRKELEQAFDAQYDTVNAGWGFGHKYLDARALEWATLRAREGDAVAGERARQTLDAQRVLIDPAWGGVYQYSAGGDWLHPHYEKIMSVQAANLRAYAGAWQAWHLAKDLDAARAIARYMADFLTAPDGAFYTSQDADLRAGEKADAYFALDGVARRRLGIPVVDNHRYARENGWAIEAMTALYAADPQADTLHRAVEGAHWILGHRALGDGAFRHDAKDPAGPFLGDTLAMGRAFLALYTVTAEREWLAHAEAAADAIDHPFRPPGGAGYDTAAAAPAAALRPRPLRDENLDLARFALLLHHVTGEPRYRAMAERAMRFLTIPEVARRYPAAAALLADREWRTEPLHLTIVGPKDDTVARNLFLAAIGAPGEYKRVDWLDRKRGPLRRADVEYPELARPALFICTGSRCSVPIFRPEDLQTRLDRLLAQADRPAS